MSSLKQKAISGSIWVIVGYGSSQFLRLISNLILTRLLVPELFGLMALVNTFIVGLTLFSDVGIRPSIIRSNRGEDPIFLNTAWTLQVIRGCGLWICSVLISFPVAQFYGEPKLMWLIPIVGFNSIIAGFDSTSLAVLNRNIEIRKLTIISLATQIIALTTTIIWAYFQPTIWALIIGTFVSKLVYLYCSHRISSITHRFIWNKEALTELVSFGRWIFVSTAMTFLASQSDRLILGKLFPLDMLGVYAVALTFAKIPENIINKLNSSIIMPLISQKINLPRQELKQKILNKRKYLLGACVVLISLMFCFGDSLIAFLYPEKYADATWMVPILALGLWPLILVQSIGKSLFALGKPQYHAVGTFLKFAYMSVVLPFVLLNTNSFWAIWVIAFNDIPIYTVTHYGLYKHGFSCLKQDIQFTIILILISVLFLSSRYYLTQNIPLIELLQNNILSL